MGHVMFMQKGNEHTEPGSLPVGTMWLFTSNGSFEAPEDGQYQIEMHGGGGGGAYYVWGWQDEYEETHGAVPGGGGGGSGEIKTITLAKGDVNAITIGAGGAAGISYGSSGGAGGTTKFGSLSVEGGKGATLGYITYDYIRNSAGGAASGSIATAGGTGVGAWDKATYTGGAGGLGNSANAAQPYGNGGAGTSAKYNYASSVNASVVAQPGQPGAVIITYLGKG